MNRRQFITNVSAASLAAAPWPITTRSHAAPTPKKRIAFLGSEIREHSHSQHFLDRLAMGYGWQGAWQTPRVEIASIYVDQFPKQDLGRQRIAKYGLKSYPTIAEALTLGTDRLAVDGIVIIAEHGDYPRNEKGQTLYPRYQWFKECARVIEASGRPVPIFNDKHLSTNWDECVDMVNDAKRLGIPFFAGSSLPVTRRMPSIDMPYKTPLKESVCVAYGGVDSYDIHALETAQCMSERRRGGEPGIQSVLALKDERAWQELFKPERSDTLKLVVAALTRSHNLPVEGGYYSGPITAEWARKTLAKVTAYFIDHLDGFRTTMVLTNIRDFNYAGLQAETGEIISTQMYLPMPTHGSSTADFFHPLCRHIENTVLTGRTPYPIERTLLTSGMTLAGVESLYQGQVLIPTPEMAIPYQVGPESTFWRG